MTNYFEDNDGDSCVTNHTLPREFVNAVDTFKNHRELLEKMNGDGYFRIELRDDVTYDDICDLSSAGLIEFNEPPQGEKILDWETTRRTSYLINSLPDDFTLSPVEVSAIFAVGDDFCSVPGPSHTWRLREINVDLDDRSLLVLRGAGLLQISDLPDGITSSYSTTQRMETLQSLVRGFLYS
ncbi:hypothetical protein PM023_13060 [Halorubrum ezzemoulense]|uniref:hypothetical protein n=1 Tax=Halorubrum ezzemoulense TaxID=337243 RepID=UPI00232AEC58|nr:hypothetical protein [Halorubrum ezzemoulense]MDB2225599.1 hypothetical protein [Halorubrum ezzemoulense]